MGIFAKLAQLIRSNLNSAISRAEDPEKMLNQLVIEMAEQLEEAKRQVASAIADEKRLAKELEQERATAADWERRAMLAVRAGDDGLASEALVRKKEHESLAGQLAEQWQKQRDAVEKLKTALRVLHGKIEEAKRKKNVLVARKKRAEAQKSIQETLSGLRDASAFETFDRMASRIEQMEAEAEAHAELAEEATGDRLKHQFATLEATAGATEDLAALKRKMGLAPPAAEAPPAAAQPTTQVRVAEAPEAPPAARGADELSAALAELEAEEQREQQRMKR
jgi:phage shock protein A